MRSRSRYWSCTKFADWLRGTPKPPAATSKDWHNWNFKARTEHPYRYWLAEEGLDAVQGFIWWPVDKLHSIKYYINNRWVTRTHCLTAHPKDIKPGDWCDVGNRFLPCLFNELVDFIEIELAWANVAWDREGKKKYDAPFWSTGWFRWRTWRCVQAGLDHLDWASKLTDEEFLDEDKKHLAKPTDQALAAVEMLELYRWWKEVRPKREDPHDATGWTQYCANNRKGFGLEDRSPVEQRRVNKMLDKMRKMEQAYDKEDTEMAIRLIKIRQSLWT